MTTPLPPTGGCSKRATTCREAIPMGDNRDDSRDARYFGPVRLEKVLGKGLFRYWPIARIGGVR